MAVVKNFSYSTVLTAPSPAISGTSIVVQPGDGSKFVVGRNATLFPANKQPLTSNAEIVTVTAISTDTLTITRAQEGTTAVSVASGYQIIQGPTAQFINDLESKPDLAGDIGGTPQSPAIKSKTVVTVGPAGSNAQYVCDGVADEVEINAALVSLGTAGGEVYIRPGTYNIAANILLTSNTIVTGAGTATKIVVATGTGLFAQFKTNITVRDLQIDSTAHITNNKMLYILNTSYVHIERITAPNCMGFGVFISSDSTNTTKNVWVKDCYLRGNGTNDIIGGGPNSTSGHVENIYLLNNTVVQDCTVNSYDNAIDLVRVEYAVYEGNQTFGSILFGSEASPHRYASITNNVIRPAINTITCGVKVQGTGSPVARSYGIVISNNRIMTGKIELFGSGSASAFQWIINSNLMLDAPEIGIEIRDAQYGIINGNIVQGANTAVKFITVSQTLFTNNVLLDGGVGIQCSSSNNNTFALNNMKNGIVTLFVGLGANDSVYANQGVNPVASYDGGNITTTATINRKNGDYQYFVLTGDTTFTFNSGTITGELLTLKFTQDVVGNRLATWPSNVKLSSGSLVLSTTASAADVVSFIWDGTNWRETARALQVSASGSGGVTSYNGRTGAVVPVGGDYSAAQITNTPAGGIVSTTVQDAINALDTDSVKVSTTQTVSGTKTFSALLTALRLSATATTGTILQGASVDQGSSPWIALGATGNNYALGVSGGRGMFGYDGTGGKTIIGAGAGKGISMYVNGTNNSWLTGTKVIDILSTGLVGIGKTPTTVLDVSGTITATTFAGSGASLTAIPQSAITDLSTDLAGKAATTHTHLSTGITDFDEAVEDKIGSKIVAGSNITVTYDDTAGTTTIASTGGGGGTGVADGDKGDITVSGTGTVWTLDGKPTGTIVGTSDTQTLTNKTISGTSNTLTNIPQLEMDIVRRRPFLFSDFMVASNNVAPFLGVARNSGTMAAVTSSVFTANHPGILRLSSSVSADSGYAFGTETGQMLLGGGEIFEAVFQIVTTTNTTTRVGFHDTTSITDAVDGVYMEIVGTTLSGKTASNSTRSTAATTYTVSTLTWYRAKVYVNSSSLVTFTLYNDSGTVLWTETLTANIPVASTRVTGAALVTTSSNVAITALVDLDYMAVSFGTDRIR